MIYFFIVFSSLIVDFFFQVKMTPEIIEVIKNNYHFSPSKDFLLMPLPCMAKNKFG